MIAGTPIVVESDVELQFTVADSGVGILAQSATVSTSFRVRPPPVALTTTTLPNAEVSIAYSATLAAMDGLEPYSFTISDGLLPDGLHLNGSTGVISGTPTAAGTATFTVEVTDSDDPETTDSFELSITVE